MFRNSEHQRKWYNFMANLDKVFFFFNWQSPHQPFSLRTMQQGNPCREAPYFMPTGIEPLPEAPRGRMGRHQTHHWGCQEQVSETEPRVGLVRTRAMVQACQANTFEASLSFLSRCSLPSLGLPFDCFEEALPVDVGQIRFKANP